MLMPSIFRTNVFDDFFEDPFKDFGRRAVGRPVNDLMKTDIKENEDGYEVSIAMPGVKKEDIQAELKEGYLTVTATTKQDKDEKDDKGRSPRAFLRHSEEKLLCRRGCKAGGYQGEVHRRRSGS